MRVLYHCERKQKNYLQTKETVTCDCCGKELKIMDCVIIHSSFTKKNAIPRRYTCFDEKCINKFRSELVSSWLPAFVVEEVPFGCNIVPDVNIEIGTGKGIATVFTAAISNEGIQSDASSCMTLDYTRLAGRESFEGAQIGADVRPLLEEKDREIKSEAEAKALLSSLLNAQIEGPEEKKRIEDKTK